jgi:hypothetical protein
MFLLSFFQIPIGVRKRLDYYRSRFFWQSDQNKKKYRRSKWNMYVAQRTKVVWVSRSCIAEVQAKPTVSPFWKGLMQQKDTFFKYGSFIIGDGEGTRFWGDTWLGAEPLAPNTPASVPLLTTKISLWLVPSKRTIG